jgi:hypothetical protein
MQRPNDIVQDTKESRNLCKGPEYEYERARNYILANQPNCHICLFPIDRSLKSPHPGSPSADHFMKGHRVEDMVGKRRADAKRILCSIEYMKAAHLGCNASRNRNDNKPSTYAYAPPKPKTNPSRDWSEPTFVTYINKRTGESFIGLSNATILDPEYERVANDAADV